MRAGGVLRIQSTLEDCWVRITFADTGGGISAADMSKIFEPYFTTKAGGSGLGLLIVRRIVREHGGEIDLVSQEGKGLVFIIRLPVRDTRVRLLAAPLQEETPANGESGS
jgi:signal transduction histidine kinase